MVRVLVLVSDASIEQLMEACLQLRSERWLVFQSLCCLSSSVELTQEVLLLFQLTSLVELTQKGKYACDVGRGFATGLVQCRSSGGQESAAPQKTSSLDNFVVCSVQLGGNQFLCVKIKGKRWCHLDPWMWQDA